MKTKKRLWIPIICLALVLGFIFANVTTVFAADEIGITPSQLDKMAIDPQSWRLHDAMTWEDFAPNPAIDWKADDHNVPAKRKMKGLMVLVDYYDRGLITLDPLGSDPIGNPQVRVDTENGETAAEFWAKFLGEPGPWNHYTSINQHWAENSYGQWDIDFDVVGPFTMPYFEFQYGFYSSNIQNSVTWPTLFPNAYSLRGTHPYHIALQNGFKFWDSITGTLDYDFMFVNSAGYDQSNTWQPLGEMMFANKMSVYNAPAGSLKNPNTGEPLGDHISGYDFTGLARMDKIKGIITAEGFDIIRDWPHFYMSDIDMLWKQHITGISAMIWFGLAFPSVPSGAFLTALEADEAVNLAPAFAAYRAANPGANYTSTGQTTYRNNLYRFEFLDKYAKQMKLIDINGPDSVENWTDAYKSFRNANTSEIIIGRVLDKVEEARRIAINSTTNPNFGWAVSRYGSDPWSSWYGALPIWGHAANTTDVFVNRTSSYSVQGECDGTGTYSHEFSHITGIQDNYTDAFADTPARVPVSFWDLMGSGTSNGPGGHPARWLIPSSKGEAVPPNQVLRGKIINGFHGAANSAERRENVYEITYANLGNQLAIEEVFARNIPTNLGIKDANGKDIAGYRGIRVTGMTNRIPRETAANNCLPGFDMYGLRRIDPAKWNWGSNATFVGYTMEVVQQTGYDSFEPDSGVLLALNHDDTISRATNSTFIVDANPGGLNFADYYHPTTGAFVSLRDGNIQQIATALFHAGVHNDPTYYKNIGERTNKWAPYDERIGIAGEVKNEYKDTYNNLHFYVLSKNYTPGKHGEILSYDIAVRRTDGSYSSDGNLLLSPVGNPIPAAMGNFAVQRYSLTNTAENTDIVRITLSGELTKTIGFGHTKDQNVVVLNNLYAIGGGETIEFDVFIKEATNNNQEYDTSELLTITASSETNIDKTTGITGPVLPKGPMVEPAPSAFVTKLNGNQNDLTITVTEIYADGTTEPPITMTFKINNNAEGVYDVGGYKVYVDTKGNEQIRACYIL